jgi:hypothetical protein
MRVISWRVLLAIAALATPACNQLLGIDPPVDPVDSGSPGNGGRGGGSGGTGMGVGSGGGGGVPITGTGGTGAGGYAGSGGSGGSAGHGGSGGGSGGSGTGNGGSTGSGGSTATGGSGGMTAAGGSGGSGHGGSGGSVGTGTGGSTVTGGSGGMTANGGAGGMTATGGSGGMTAAGGSGGSTVTGGSGGMTANGGAGGMTATGGAGGSPVIIGPCDVLAAAGNPCVAAHSTVRALSGKYTGPLYQVCRGPAVAGPNSCSPGSTTMDIGLVAGGYADSATQNAFCAGATCTISIIYDQSSNGNHLQPAPRGGAKASADNPANATDLSTTINGHPVYGIFIKAGIGYRAGCTGCSVATGKGTATGDQPETLYMVTSQNGLVDGCCFDYGNAETDNSDDGNGTMEAVYFGGGVVWDTGAEGGHSNNTNPWVMADLQNGLFAGFSTTNPSNAQTITTNTALHFNFVTAIVVGDTAAQNAGLGRFAILGGDATSGTLKTMYDGIRPTLTGFVPMKKQGSIVLGIGGDNSDSSAGQFFEGVMASGAATVTTLNALQANIVAAGYGK